MSYTLKASNGASFTVTREVAFMSSLIRELNEDRPEDEDQCITFDQVNAEELEKIVEWETHHVNNKDEYRWITNITNIPKPLTRPIKECVSRYDNAFFAKLLEVDENGRFKYIKKFLTAVDYMKVEGCLEVGCAFLADALKGLSPADIRKRLGISDELAP